MKTLVRRFVWISLAALVVVLIVRAFRGSPVLVDVATIGRGLLRVTVDDDGRTRVRERYTISAPIQGRLLRTLLDPGDLVRAGETPVAEFVPIAPELLDARTRAEAEARTRRAEASLHEAEAREEQAEADLRYAETLLERVRELAAEGIEGKNRLDLAMRDEESARQGRRAAQFAVQVAAYELDAARASLIEATPDAVGPDDTDPDEGNANPADASTRSVERVNGDGRLLLRSPIDGTVLLVFEESARALSAGAPILEVGSIAALEVVADYLSQDAVKIRPGMEVLVEGWGGATNDDEATLRGRVRVVEPSGFTKVSALGVEEQRVNVIVDPVGPPEDWAVIGDGYRVELRVVLWEEENALIVPTGALFRRGGDWSVFLVENGRARRRTIEIGRQNGLEAEVANGLREGERVILYPSDLLEDGTRIEPR